MQSAGRFYFPVYNLPLRILPARLKVNIPDILNWKSKKKLNTCIGPKLLHCSLISNVYTPVSRVTHSNSGNLRSSGSKIV